MASLLTPKEKIERYNYITSKQYQSDRANYTKATYKAHIDECRSLKKEILEWKEALALLVNQ